MPVPYVSINPSKKREVQAILDYNFDMKLYVIGNGFDLAHGMETSYGKYLSYVKQKLMITINGATYWITIQKIINSGQTPKDIFVK